MKLHLILLSAILTVSVTLQAASEKPLPLPKMYEGMSTQEVSLVCSGMMSRAARLVYAKADVSLKEREAMAKEFLIMGTAWHMQATELGGSTEQMHMLKDKLSGGEAELRYCSFTGLSIYAKRSDFDRELANSVAEQTLQQLAIEKQE